MPPSSARGIEPYGGPKKDRYAACHEDLTGPASRGAVSGQHKAEQRALHPVHDLRMEEDLL